tara:strand:+ start:50 stop:832 length:783 start_codon:yes stop_codon:yes gene_type:complete
METINFDKSEENENFIQDQEEDLEEPTQIERDVEDEEQEEDKNEEEDEEDEEEEEQEGEEEEEEEDGEEEEEEDGEEEEEQEVEEEDGENKDQEKDKSKKKIKYKAPKKVSTLSSSNYAYNVEDELFVEEQNFEKIDESLKKSYVETYHPECNHKNYDEMFKLTFIQRNNDNIIQDPIHKTIPFMTKYEKTKIIGLRVKQLNNGARPFINIEQVFNTKTILDNYLIAEKELMMKKLPFIISRPITNKHNEYWNLKDLEII